jgi:hypothetical protein
MDDAIAKIVGGLLLLMMIIAVVALLVFAAIVAIAVLGPPVGAGYWLRHMLQNRYQLGAKKARNCILIGLGVFAVPMLALLSPAISSSGWNVGTVFWISTTGGLLTVALYLAISVYREVFWPQRKIIIQAARECLRFRAQLIRMGFSLNRLDRLVRRVERVHGGRIQEIQQLQRLSDEIVRTSDPAFYSAERLRWEQLYGGSNEAELKSEYSRVQQELAGTDRQHPRFITLTLQSAVIRVIIQSRNIEALPGGDYTGNVLLRNRFRTDVDETRRRLADRERAAQEAQLTLKQLRRQRVPVA